MKVSEFSLILKPSTIPGAGIGVFAAEDIAKGVDVLVLSDVPAVSRNKNEIPKNFRHFCLKESEDKLLCPENFNKIDVTWFLNHSFEPNIVRFNGGDVYKAVRDIKEGEEVLMDYNDIGEPEHLKDDFYKK